MIIIFYTYGGLYRHSKLSFSGMLNNLKNTSNYYS